MKRAVYVLLLVVAVGVGAGAYYMRRNGSEPQVVTSPVTRGPIVDTVGASGTLQAVTTVQIGSQVSGNIQYLGADFNSIVKKGQVVARLDPSLFQAQLEQARGNLGQTRANLTKAQSDLERAKVQLTDAQQKYTRAKELSSRNLLPQSDLDAAKIAVDTAQAALQSQQATVLQTQAAVAQSQASVSQAQVNLDHTVITAPIDGIVTQRSVDVGQTVAASLQSPTLFIIAADLTKMQVNASIDEADVGRIRPNQRVTFRVDAYPTEEFSGTVAQIRLQPVVVQNVTTYGTVIDVPNPQLKLKPGMTATVKLEVGRRDDVLRVPNAALRFRPSNDVFAALNQPVPTETQFAGGRGGRGAMSGGAAQAPQPTSPSTAPPPAASGRGTGPSSPSTDTSSAVGGRRGFGGGRGGGVPGAQGGGGTDADRRARMAERLGSMSPDEQKQFIARMKERGMDVTDLEKSMAGTNAQAPGSPAAAPKAGEPQAAQTIDALFGPLPTIETQGRAWLYVDKQLKPVRLRLGLTDGTNTELLGEELQPGTEVVTGVILGGTRTTTVQQTGTGNPLMPQRGGPPGGFPGGGRGR